MHLHEDRQKLLSRVRRIRGQVEALERMISAEGDCADVLHLIVACRGGLGSLMTQVLEGHVRSHVLDPKRKPTDEQVEAAEQLLDVIRSYLT